MDMSARLEEFRKMTEADPENEVGHFSLGRAYLETGNFTAAAASFNRVIDLRPDMSRAYEMLASTLLKQGNKTEAIETLTRGVRIAHSRGDVMPRNTMSKMLQELGAAVPEMEAPRVQQTAGEGEVHCARCGRVGAKIAKPPFNNEVGKTIQEKICIPCWREWIGMGTKVINELRLPLNDPQAQKIYDAHMLEFLNLK